MRNYADKLRKGCLSVAKGSSDGTSAMYRSCFDNVVWKSIELRCKLRDRYLNRIWLDNDKAAIDEYHRYNDKLNRINRHRAMIRPAPRYYGPIGSAKEVSSRMTVKAGRHTKGEVYDPQDELLLTKAEITKSALQITRYADLERTKRETHPVHNDVLVDMAVWFKLIGYSDYEVLNIMHGRFTIDADILKSYYRLGYIAYGDNGCFYIAKCNFKSKDKKDIYAVVVEVFLEDHTEVLVPILSSYDF